MNVAVADLTTVAIGRARVHQVQPAAAADLVCDLAATGVRGQLIVTPNISHIALLEGSEKLRVAYERAVLVVPDGWPVARVMQLRSGRPQARVNGTALVIDVSRRAAHRGLRVAFVGGAADSAQRCSEVLTAALGGLQVALVDSAPQESMATTTGVAALLSRVRAARPDILFLGLGAPKQEIFAVEHDLDPGV